jgi:hypothetical protein
VANLRIFALKAFKAEPEYWHALEGLSLFSLQPFLDVQESNSHIAAKCSLAEENIAVHAVARGWVSVKTPCYVKSIFPLHSSQLPLSSQAASS